MSEEHHIRLRRVEDDHLGAEWVASIDFGALRGSTFVAACPYQALAGLAIYMAKNEDLAGRGA